jgi:hypothetical protein
MIEDRILLALLLIAALALGFGWLTMRKFIERKEFKERQQGRKKPHKPVSFEPAE